MVVLLGGVGRDGNGKCGWERAEDRSNGVSVGAGDHPIARDVVKVRLVGDEDVAVGVEAGIEFLALVAEIGLSGEDRLGWGWGCQLAGTVEAGVRVGWRRRGCHDRWVLPCPSFPSRICELRPPSKPPLKRFSRSIRQNRTRPRGSQPRGGFGIVGVITSMEVGIGLDALPLGFGPGDAPC